MRSMDPAILVLISIPLIFGSVLGYGIIVTNIDIKVSKISRVEVIDSLSINYQVMKGIVESPSVIIIVETFTEFKDKCEELNAETVYYGDWKHFYVFNDDLSIAWRFTIKVEGSGFLLLNRRWANP